MADIEIEVPLPDDWHVHLRDDEMLAAVVGYTARRFRYAMEMPNLVPPVTDTAEIVSARNSSATRFSSASDIPFRSAG